MFKDPQGKEYASTREFIASKGPGVSRETMAGFERKMERQNVLLYILVGAFFGLILGIVILLIIKLIRPEISIISPIGIGLILAALILGTIAGGLVLALK